ncbi:MAG TPA: HEAT repeat domain-containing protein [Bryobacteraceae bacterium]|nr:HEAT repeat domain-containing protein [Bryobacteraceae bacterium]
MRVPSSRLVLGFALFTAFVAQSLLAQTTNERILSIRELGKRNPSVLPVLAGYLSDPNTDIRLEAVKSIVRIDTPASVDPLVQATHDRDSEIEIRSTDGIVNAYLPGYVARTGLTGSLTRGVRQMKSFFSARNDQVINADVQVRPDVQQALADLVAKGSGDDARANAALASGILRNRTAVPALSDALRSKDDDLIFESLVALQKIKDPSAGRSVSVLANDLNERIQLTALETIGVLGSRESAPEVRSALSHARNLKVRRSALQTLAMLGQPEDRSTFLNDAESRDVQIRSSALEGLGRIREPADMPVLQKAFDEGEIDWRIHLAAAFGMVNEGKIDTGEFDPLPFLLECLGTRGRADTAAAYLTELGNRENVRAALIKMVPTLDKSQKIALCPVFGKIGTPDVVETLHTLAKDIDPDVAVAASQALKTQQSRSQS